MSSKPPSRDGLATDVSCPAEKAANQLGDSAVPVGSCACQQFLSLSTSTPDLDHDTTTSELANFIRSVRIRSRRGEDV